MPDAPDQARWVLVVDDDPLIRDTITEILEESGYRVATAAHGKDALNLPRIGLRSRESGRGLGQDLDQAKLTHLTTYRATAAMS